MIRKKATTETYYMMGLLKFRIKPIRENISEPYIC